MNSLQSQILKLKKEVTINEAAFEDNDDKVLYYTGLRNWQLLKTLFAYIKPHLMLKQSAFQQLIITLMRLRLNIPGQDLAYKFGVHSSTVSRTFIHVIDVLYSKLKPLIIWPDRDSLMKTMPMDLGNIALNV